MAEINRIQKIYDAIADKTSKDIFCSRLLYSITSDETRIKWMMQEFEKNAESNKKWNDLKKEIQNLKNKPYIFSMGSYGKVLCKKTGGAKTWSGFIDNTPGTDTCMEMPVLKAVDFLKRYSGETIALPSKAYFYEMRKQLIDAGVEESNIIDATAWYDATEGKQYFDLPYLTYDSDEIFVDGGSCDGMSAVRFIEQCGGCYQKIYCFEPDRKNIVRIQRNLQTRNIVNYEIVEKGLWNEKKELLFAANGSANSHITQNVTDNSVKIQVTTLDETVVGQKVSFIKMDVEGAEYEALQGAKQTIAKYKPKLAICVYHRPEDIWEIPDLVLNLRSDYKLYFRHYSVGPLETVMYAI